MTSSKIMNWILSKEFHIQKMGVLSTTTQENLYKTWIAYPFRHILFSKWRGIEGFQTGELWALADVPINAHSVRLLICGVVILDLGVLKI